MLNANCGHLGIDQNDAAAGQYGNADRHSENHALVHQGTKPKTVDSRLLGLGGFRLSQLSGKQPCDLRGF